MRYPGRTPRPPRACPRSSLRPLTGGGTEARLGLSDRRIPVITLSLGPAPVDLGIGFLGVRMRRRRAARDGPGPP